MLRQKSRGVLVQAVEGLITDHERILRHSSAIVCGVCVIKTDGDGCASTLMSDT